jgi:hypothetical protein
VGKTLKNEVRAEAQGTTPARGIAIVNQPDDI